MGSGVDAVEAVIDREFGPVNISKRIDPEIFSVVLSFKAEGRTFTVRVSDEFDEDFASGTTAGVDEPGSRLRTSASGNVAVTDRNSRAMN
jgi:hypothetical protein